MINEKVIFNSKVEMPSEISFLLTEPTAHLCNGIAYCRGQLVKNGKASSINSRVESRGFENT